MAPAQALSSWPFPHCRLSALMLAPFGCFSAGAYVNHCRRLCAGAGVATFLTLLAITEQLALKPASWQHAATRWSQRLRVCAVKQAPA